MKKVSLFILFAGIFQSCVNNNNPHHRGNNPHMTSKPDTTIHYLQEKHLTVDGSNLRQITHLGKANRAPFFAPDGKRIIFSSNHAGKRGFEFNLYMINVDGTGLERITYDHVFDAFPMFSYDGKKLIFSSNRNNGGTHNTNLFIADWVE